VRRTLEARIAELKQHRALLAERAEAQRLELSTVCLEFEQPLRWARAAARMVAFLRNSPRFAALSTAANILIGSRLAHLRSWVSRGLMLYQLGRALRQKWQAHKLQDRAQVETAT
jgi:hypothetical protein